MRGGFIETEATHSPNTISERSESPLEAHHCRDYG
jgi:hypothetical protein